MKKKNLMKMASLVIALLTMGLSSCENEEPISIEKNEASGVEGFVTYDQVSDSEISSNQAASGATVSISYSYTVSIDGKDVEIKSVETTQTDSNGWYSFKLNVPVGGTANYTVSANFTATNDNLNGNNENVSDAKSLFTISNTGSVNYGDITIENLKAVSKGIVEQDYAN